VPGKLKMSAPAMKQTAMGESRRKLAIPAASAI
jgi:hypothetical protein